MGGAGRLERKRRYRGNDRSVGRKLECCGVAGAKAGRSTWRSVVSVVGKAEEKAGRTTRFDNEETSTGL